MITEIQVEICRKEKVGEGYEGIVFKIENPPSSVIKIFKEQSDFESEWAAYSELQGSELARYLPKVKIVTWKFVEELDSDHCYHAKGLLMDDLTIGYPSLTEFKATVNVNPYPDNEDDGSPCQRFERARQNLIGEFFKKCVRISDSTLFIDKDNVKIVKLVDISKCC